jgi:orotidine-5'-phosphate decarboxylase
MNAAQLFGQIKKKQSFLSIGLDTDINKIPGHLHAEKNPVFAFNRAIIDATAHLMVACKPNLAFYESRGSAGWQDFEQTVDYIKSNYPEIFVIADAKRGDIGNTSKMYARAFFEETGCDAVTINPYMGSDSVIPFLGYNDKWAVILALTSNKSAEEFQLFTDKQNKQLFITVLEQSKTWGTAENMMYVAGATKASMLVRIREIIPDHFLLIPGVGAQGGDLNEVARYGLNSRCGLLVNSSRGIIYTDSTRNFAEAAKHAAEKIQKEMSVILAKNKLI